MLQIQTHGTRLCDGLSRRAWLTVGALGPLGLTAPQWWQATAQGSETASPSAPSPKPRGTAKACIQIFLWGGPGAQEMWDLKPDAPSGIRGDFRPIATSVAGIHYSEHLPRLAQRAHQYTIIRSQTHTGVNHGTSSYHMLTGHIHWSPGTLRHPTRSDMPNLGCNAGRFLPHPEYLPPHVQLPAVINDGDNLPVPGQDPGILGEAHTPFRVLGDLTQSGFKVPALTLAQGLSRERLARRAGLREAIDSQLGHLSRETSGQSVEGSYARAVSLLASPETEAAFDLAREPAPLRDRYGMHHFSQALLLARRLVESGVPFVTVYWQSPNNADFASWDTHANQHVRLREHLLPAFDQSLSALLDDLTERGMLDETLVTWWGEFGRTPRINSAGGRDHWGFCQSVGLAGGGIQRGLAYGTSTKDGGYAETCPVTPDDLSATMFHCLGIDHRQHMHDLQGRPVRLSFGEPVREILTDDCSMS
ncbi:MAG: DUF1501 domain-containing protein [Planctomycetales bacterium]